MNILTLSIKQNYFDEIKAGKKKKETREIRANNSERYIYYKSGKKTWKKYTDVPSEITPDVEPVKYDAIKFLTGAYSGTRPSMLVEVKGAQIVLITDEKDNPITYTYEGEEYAMAEIVYKLGKVIEA